MMAAQKEAGMSPVLASIARAKVQAAKEKVTKKRADSGSSAVPPRPDS
jgi:hypothetical protein